MRAYMSAIVAAVIAVIQFPNKGENFQRSVVFCLLVLVIDKLTEGR